jgi:hypothetical protein
MGSYRQIVLLKREAQALKLKLENVSKKIILIIDLKSLSYTNKLVCLSLARLFSLVERLGVRLKPTREEYNQTSALPVNIRLG